MKQTAKRLMLIGMDGAMFPLVQRFIAEGTMPHLRRLAERGVSTEAIPSVPVDTPTNWTTIATGAEPHNHGILSFSSRKVGESIMAGEKARGRNKLATSVQAEFFWNAAERQGKRSLVVNYPTGWPALNGQPIVLGGHTPGGEPWHVHKQRVYATGPIRHAVVDLPSGAMDHIPIQLAPAQGWSGLSAATPALEGEMILGAGEVSERVHVAVVGSSAGYDRVIVATQRNATSPLASLKVGEWSPWIERTISNVVVTFRFKLVALTPDAKHLELYVTDLRRADGWSNPPQLASELLKQVGPYMEGLECPYVPAGEERRPYGPLNVAEDIMLELGQFQADWMADACRYLLSSQGWDVMFLHYHLMDAVNHTYLGYLDPTFPYTNPRLTEKVWQIYRDSYRIVDHLIGRLVDECADGETLVTVTSDHAALPTWRYVSVGRALAEKGLLNYDWDSKAQCFAMDPRSVAVPYLEPQHVWINLDGRDPEGVVPEKDYQRRCEEVIRALYEIRDPATGESVMQLACHREDLGLIGPGGYIGDIVYFLKPGYSTWDGMIGSVKATSQSPDDVAKGVVMPTDLVAGHHTSFLPTAKHNGLANGAMTYMAGPGVRENYLRPAPIHLKDLSPTMAHLMDLEPPRNAEGGVLRDLFKET